MRIQFENILFLAAHPDDEIGCAGTLTRLVNQSTRVTYVAFSACEESVPPGYPPDVLRSEAQESARVLGLDAKRVDLRSYRVRHFPEYRQAILEDMVELRRQIQPDLLLVPALSDIHQDQEVVAREGVRAFKYCSILGYEMPMNTLSFTNACYVHLDSGDMKKKLEAIYCYKSQLKKPYSSEEFVMSLARMRGVQSGAEFAEAFEVIRLTL